MSAAEMVCPVCGSSEVTGDSWEMDAAAAQSWQEVSCDDCGSSWEDVYRFSHRENVRHGSRVGVALARVGADRVAMSEALDALAIVRRLDAAGLMCQVLDALAAEEGGDEDEEDDEWTDCNDDGGAVCNAAAGFPCSACAAARGVTA